MQSINVIGRLIRKYNPLGAAKWLLSRSISIAGKSGPMASLLTSLEIRLSRFQQRLDFQEYDQSHGTDTCSMIPLEKLNVSSASTADGIWYEGTSPKIFRQLMDNLEIAPEEYAFIDYGSGKGRVLLLAAEHGFRKIEGVEFARDLHETAIQNASIFNRGKTNPVTFKFHHMDAVDYQLPDVPLVIFFYCPFLGNVLDRVLTNIKTSCNHHPRSIHIVFYGQNPTAINQFHSIGFISREIKLKRDWTRFKHYRGFIFSSPNT